MWDWPPCAAQLMNGGTAGMTVERTRDGTVARRHGDESRCAVRYGRRPERMMTERLTPELERGAGRQRHTWCF